MKEPEREQMGSQFENTLDKNTVSDEVKILFKSNRKNLFIIFSLSILCAILLTVADFVSTGIFFGKLGANTPSEILDFYREQFVTTLQDISAGRFFYTTLIKGMCFIMPLLVIMICEVVVRTKINYRIASSLLYVTATVVSFTLVTYVTGVLFTIAYFYRLDLGGVFINDMVMQHSFTVMLQICLLSLLWSWLWCVCVLMILNNCRYELRAILGMLLIYLLPNVFNFSISIQTLFLEPAYFIVNQALNVEHMLISSVMNPLYYVGVMAITFIVIVVYAFYQEGLSYT